MQGTFLAAAPRRLLTCIVVVLVSLFAVGALAADARVESEAKALQKKAIEEDFLNVDYASAIKKLQSAAGKCGADKCSPALKAAVLRDLGAMQVLAGNNDEGRSNFAQALAIDSSLELDPSYKNPQLEAVWNDVKKKGAGGGAAAGGGGAAGGGAAAGPTSQPSGDFTHTPAPEQLVRTPLPIYVEYPGSETIAKVIVKYKGFGMSDWKALELTKMGNGWGGVIPCKDVMQGPMQYYVQGFNAQNDPVATSGGRNKPYTVPIKPQITSAPPSLPGQEPPKQCSELTGAECPPDFPGCSNKKAGGEDCDKDDQCSSGSCVGGKCAEKKGGGESCESDDECASGSCSDGSCTEATKKGAGEDCESDDECDSGTCGKDGKCTAAGAKFRRIWVGASVSMDFLFVPAENDVCLLNSGGTGPFTQGNPYSCVSGSGNDFPGTDQNANNAITPSPNGTHADQVAASGFAPGALHLTAAIDYALTKNILLGGRIGIELMTYPGSIGGPASPLPILNIEPRVTYLFGKDGVMQQIAPMAFAGAGFGEMDAHVGVHVQCNRPGPGQPVSANGACSSPDLPMDAWVTTGPGYVYAGGGARFALGKDKRIAIPVGLKLEGAFGGSGGFLFGVAPELSIQYGF